MKGKKNILYGNFTKESALLRVKFNGSASTIKKSFIGIQVYAVRHKMRKEKPNWDTIFIAVFSAKK